jgi:hypothetical protein
LNLTQVAESLKKDPQEKTANQLILDRKKQLERQLRASTAVLKSNQALIFGSHRDSEMHDKLPAKIEVQQTQRERQLEESPVRKAAGNLTQRASTQPKVRVSSREPALRDSARSNTGSSLAAKAGLFSSIQMQRDKTLQRPSSLNDFMIGKKLGEGAYAVVHTALNKKTNDRCAMKIYDKEKVLTS